MSYRSLKAEAIFLSVKLKRLEEYFIDEKDEFEEDQFFEKLIKDVRETRDLSYEVIADVFTPNTERADNSRLRLANLSKKVDDFLAQ